MEIEKISTFEALIKNINERKRNCYLIIPDPYIEPVYGVITQIRRSVDENIKLEFKTELVLTAGRSGDVYFINRNQMLDQNKAKKVAWQYCLHKNFQAFEFIVQSEFLRRGRDIEYCAGCSCHLKHKGYGGYRNFCVSCVSVFPEFPTDNKGYVIEGAYPDFKWVELSKEGEQK